MRIIKFLFKSVLLLVVIGGLSFLIGREILLFMGISKVKSSLSSVRSMAVQRTYFAQCKAKGSTFNSGDEPVVLQLRFVSPSEYVVEVICSQFSIDPIVVEQETLPKFVTKVVGSSGIIWGEEKSGVTLEIFNRKKSVVVEDRLITTEYGIVEPGVGPKTTCVGYGFSCCQMTAEQGSGEQLLGSLDCPQSCYSQCVSRPVVLAFNTQPVFDLKERQLFISSGETVSFSFVIDAGEVEEVSVKLDYGDGKNDVFKSDKQLVDHNYQCYEERCEYLVRLSVENNQGIQAAELPIMSLKVIVKDN